MLLRSSLNRLGLGIRRGRLLYGRGRGSGPVGAGTDFAAAVLAGRRGVRRYLLIHFIEAVLFYRLYKHVGIFGIGGVTGVAQTARPPFVVGRIEIEKEAVTGRVGQKVGVVAVRVVCATVTAETLVFGVVVMKHLVAGPRCLTLYAEMVVGLERQRTVAVIGFDQSLCELYTGGYAVLLHGFHSQALIGLYVFLGGHLLVLFRTQGHARQLKHKQ